MTTKSASYNRMYPFYYARTRFAALLAVILFTFLSYSQDSVNTRNYGGRATVGVAIGGGGIVGVPVRIYLQEKAALELAAFYRPVIVMLGDGVNETTGGPMFAGGLDWYFSKRYVARRNKVRMDGIFLKGGYGLSSYVGSAMIGAGWAHEMMHQRNHTYSFSFELGPGMLFNNKRVSTVDIESTSFAVYWKVHWAWAPKSGFSSAVAGRPSKPSLLAQEQAHGQKS